MFSSRPFWLLLLSVGLSLSPRLMLTLLFATEDMDTMDRIVDMDMDIWDTTDTLIPLRSHTDLLTMASILLILIPMLILMVSITHIIHILDMGDTKADSDIAERT